MKRMKKILFYLLLALALTATVSCETGGGASAGAGEGASAEAQADAVKMTATVTSTENGGQIAVDVISGDYGVTGVYLVHLSAETAFYGANGAPISRADLKAGDTVEIRYGGQVMMSYPPQIVAGSITVLE